MKKWKYSLIFAYGLLLYGVQIYIFGWETTKVTGNPIHRLLDLFSTLFMSWGVVGDVLSNITISKVNNITAKAVNVLGQHVSKQEDDHIEKL